MLRASRKAGCVRGTIPHLRNFKHACNMLTIFVEVATNRGNQ